MTEDQLKAEFNRLEESLKHASKINAAAAAKKVIAEAHRVSAEVNADLERHISAVDAFYQESRADRLSIRTAVQKMDEKMDRVNDAMIGLQNNRLFQQGITSLALAVAIVVGWKAVGG